MKIFAVIALCASVGIAAAHAETPSACQQAIDYHQPPDPVDLATADLPADDYLNFLIACHTTLGEDDLLHPPPRSAWLEAERESYAAALEHTSAQIMVVPFQVQGYGLDRIERQILTVDLAYELTQRADVPDPSLVARALGDGLRRIELTSILNLAGRLNVRTVIVPFVGHDDDHHMTLTIQVMDLEKTANGVQVREKRQMDWRSLPFSDASPPYLVFHQMLPQIVDKLSLLTSRQTVRADARRRSPTFPVAVSPRDMVANPKVSASAGLSLLGALESPTAELARERLFERAFVISTRFDAPGPRSIFLQAYALMILGHRPAALALLGRSLRPEAVVLRALLNGDLPSARLQMRQVADLFERLLLGTGVQDLSLLYQDASPWDDRDAFAFFGASGPQWLPLLHARLADMNGWTVDSPADIKQVLDEWFPIPGLDLRTIQSSDAALGTSQGDFADAELDLAIARHVRSLVTRFGLTACCKFGAAQVNQWDLVWLLEGRAEARLSKEVTFLDALQGLPNSAQRLLDYYEPLFNGHPALAAARAAVAVAMASGAPDDMRAIWIERMRQDGLLAAYWCPGENAIAWGGLLALGTAGAKVGDILVSAYAYDFPRRSFWQPITNEKDGSFDETAYNRSVRESLAYSQADLNAVTNVPARTEEERETLRNDLQSRFVGAPGRAGILNLLRPKTAAPLDPIEALRQEVAADPHTWLNYFNLGRQLILRRDDYAGAVDVFRSYPPFHGDRVQDPVALSSEAFDAGSLLYLHGHTEESKIFYKISADLQTGSEAGMTSAARLQLLSGDFAGAMETTFERVKRYPNAYGYRDYLSDLHVTGHSDQAWNGFSQLASAFDVPQVWVSALVGHQLAGRSEAYIRDWLMRPEIRNTRLHGQQFAPAFAILWNSTDRMPPADLGAEVDGILDAPTARIQEDGVHLAKFPGESAWSRLQSPSPFRLNESPHLPPGTPVRSDLAYFAEAYVEVRYEHWAGAIEAFMRMADRYDLEYSEDAYALPYLAMAAVKTGDRIGLEKSLETFNPPEPGFFRLLAEAIFAAGRNDLDAARHFLRGAFNARPNTDDRPIFTEYEYAAVCEWLFHETKDRRFVDLLLEWIKSYETIQPVQAWPYAMEYTYERPGPRRLRALAMTMYLDPRSDRIQAASAAERAQARDWFRDNNPFQRKEPKPERSARGERAKTHSAS